MMINSCIGILFLIGIVAIVIFSVDARWIQYDYNRSVSRNNQITMRGIFALIIVISHMFRNTTCYSDIFSASILHFFFPSIVCIFFFYSGYGLMFSFMKGKQKTCMSQVVHYLKKLGVPALIIYLITVFIAFFSKTEIPAISSIGGWFAQVLLLLYVSYAVFSHFADSPLKLLVLETVFVGTFTVGAKILGIPSFVFIDLPAFLFGMLVRLDESLFQKLFGKIGVFIASVMLSFLGGSYLAMARFGIAPNGLGLGLIFGFINSISEVVMIQILLTHICFKERNLLNFLGKYSYEIYLSGAIAKPLALMIGTTPIGYYSLYSSLCILCGIIIAKTYNKLLKM